MEKIMFLDNYRHPFDDNIEYVGESVPGPGLDLEEFYSEFEISCDCVNCQCNDSRKCSCVARNGLNYDKGVIVSRKLSSYSVVECGSFCKCFNCDNRLVQKGPCPYLIIKRCEGKGFGVFSSAPLRKGTFICEYAGEVIGQAEATERMANINYQYILTLREHFSNSTLTTRIDATSIANIGRYLNHSCSPNCTLVPVRISRPVPKICIFTNCDIKENEELAYSYGSKDSKLSETLCFCKSDSCKGFLPREIVY